MILCANLSMLYADLPLPERVAAAARDGFDAVEMQFPAPEETHALRAACEAAGLPLVLINIPRESPRMKRQGHSRGLAALPGHEADFVEAMAQCVEQARALQVAKVNVLAGCPPEGSDPEACWAVLRDNLRRAGDAFGALGVRVMVEPMNPHDVPGFFLIGLRAGLEALARADHPNLALQFDLYHMALTEPDLPTAIARAGARIGHVQFADTPGRHEPGTGRIDFPAALAALRATGYAGALSAEYRPSRSTQTTLGWMPGFREAFS